ncbi:Imm63 family immunity protein [Streptomyces sp. enrichment culture]|uniref:Imm63 family immunity protein n=1 Tax=Streptomyces sp. enrichment culture TaxID=1795815 RepID=UPI003F559F23
MVEREAVAGVSGDEQARVRRYVAERIAELGRLAELPAERLPGFENRDGAYPFIEVGRDGELRYLAYERGRKVLDLRTRDPQELLYWAFRDATYEAAGVWASRHPREAEEYRVTLWRRQFAMLHTLRPAWARRRREELVASLRDPAHIRLVPGLPLLPEG